MPPGCVAWWLLLPLAVFSLATATDLQPNVTGDVTLTTAGSPWVVKNTVYVEETGSLTVEPGVTVLMASGASLLVYGQLVADGTESDHIQFTLLDSRNKTEGLQPDPLPVDCLQLPHWGVIALLNVTMTHRINYVDISCGGQDASDARSTEYNGAALYATSNVFAMSNVVVSQSAQNGIELVHVMSSLSVINVTVNDNHETGLKIVYEPQTSVIANVHAARK
ncbi:hypothetical protein NP493_884g04032 [Ridgeia piscesae]|uniref:Right handed beta helix domain-containing protein n=1 Tax=Ridgeia piscesae TaxID=27915 RepID=A0AAD9KLE6_RIDPI|nr:hypothetical protein NP493_884g04032 [Ridgeia piscesae]